MSPLSNAIARASRGLDWSYPCLIWVADYVRDVTGEDPAAALRHIEWDQQRAQRCLARLAKRGEGGSDVERVLDHIAKRDGWIEAECAMQGAAMVGVYDGAVADGPLWRHIGVPAIYDGQKRWICSNDGATVSSVEMKPLRTWELPRAAA